MAVLVTLSICAVSNARLTSADNTPGTLASAFSTRLEQEAQDMPLIERVNSLLGLLVNGVFFISALVKAVLLLNVI